MHKKSFGRGAGLSLVSLAVLGTAFAARAGALTDAAALKAQEAAAMQEYLLYAALGVSALALLLTLLSLWVAIQAKTSARNNADKVVMLKKELQRATEEAAKANQTIQELEARTAAQPREITRQGAQEAAQAASRKTAQEPSEPAAIEPQEVKDARRYAPFVAAYNAMMAEPAQGYGQRAQRDSFLQKFQLKGFSCKNYDERMSNPGIPAVFTWDAQPIASHYWAFSLGDNRYAVVPNIKNYEAQNHTTAGFKETFQSNFDGGSYSKIYVGAPAVFSGLELERQGSLKLEK